MITQTYYKVQLNDGRILSDVYETRQDALRAHRGNVSKLIEIVPKEKKSKLIETTDDYALLISARSGEDLDISMDCGYAVMYNCPKKERIYPGMKYLEVSDDYVLEAEIERLEKYEKGAHHHWKGPGYKPNKVWEWAIFHRNGKLIKRQNAETRYSNPLKGTQGGISYIKI